MKTQNDIIKEVLVRANASTTEGFYTDTMLKDWYVQSTEWASGRYKWPFTEGKVSTTYTTSNTDEYDNVMISYPEGWRSDSIRILTVGGKRLQKTAFQDLLKFKEDNPSNTERIYSDYNGTLYINSSADVSGTLTMFGQYVPVIDVTDESATSFFGDNKEGNEALVEKMLALAFTRERSPVGSQGGNPTSASMMHEQKATQILDLLWKGIKDEQFGYQAKDREMFEYLDVLNGGTSFNSNQF